jgi:hypothetical protein
VVELAVVEVEEESMAPGFFCSGEALASSGAEEEDAKAAIKRRCQTLKHLIEVRETEQ